MANAPASVGLVGGDCNSSLLCGVRCVTIQEVAAKSYWSFGAARSYIYMGIDGIAPVLSALLAGTVMITGVAACAASG